MLTILFDGIAYGMLLFVLACGLSITLGLMNFINLAHGVFAMAGGYVTVLMMNRYGISFYWCLPAAFVVVSPVRSLARTFTRSGLPPIGSSNQAPGKGERPRMWLCTSRAGREKSMRVSALSILAA